MFSAALARSPEYSACSAYRHDRVDQQPFDAARRRPRGRLGAARSARPPPAGAGGESAAVPSRRPRREGASERAAAAGAPRPRPRRRDTAGQQVHGPAVGRDRQPERAARTRPAAGTPRGGGASPATSAAITTSAPSEPRGDRARARQARRERAAAGSSSRATQRRAHGATSVKLRGESTVLAAGRAGSRARDIRPADASAPAFRGSEDPCARSGVTICAVAARRAAAPVPAQRELFVARRAGGRARASRRCCRASR